MTVPTPLPVQSSLVDEDTHDFFKNCGLHARRQRRFHWKNVHLASQERAARRKASLRRLRAKCVDDIANAIKTDSDHDLYVNSADRLFGKTNRLLIGAKNDHQRVNADDGHDRDHYHPINKRADKEVYGASSSNSRSSEKCRTTRREQRKLRRRALKNCLRAGAKDSGTKQTLHLLDFFGISSRALAEEGGLSSLARPPTPPTCVFEALGYCCPQCYFYIIRVEERMVLPRPATSVVRFPETIEVRSLANSEDEDSAVRVEIATRGLGSVGLLRQGLAAALTRRGRRHGGLGAEKEESADVFPYQVGLLYQDEDRVDWFAGEGARVTAGGGQLHHHLAKENNDEFDEDDGPAVSQEGCFPDPAGGPDFRVIYDGDELSRKMLRSLRYVISVRGVVPDWWYDHRGNESGLLTSQDSVEAFERARRQAWPMPAIEICAAVEQQLIDLFHERFPTVPTAFLRAFPAGGDEFYGENEGPGLYPPPTIYI